MLVPQRPGGLGGPTPEAPTDPDVRITRIWLLISCRCAAEHAVDYTSPWEAVALLQVLEGFPRRTAAAAPRQPTLPDLPGPLQVLLEAKEVASYPVVRIVALQLLLQRLVLYLDRSMPVLATPIR
jgi:hypothetical protein